MDLIPFIRNSREREPVSGLLILFGILAIAFVIAQVVLAVILVVFLTQSDGEFSLKNIGDGLSGLYSSPSGWWVLNTAQGVASLIMFVFAGLFYWNVVEKKKWTDFNSNILPALGIFITVFLIQIGFAPFIAYLGSINEAIQLPEALRTLENLMKGMEESAMEMTEFLAKTDSIPQLLANILVIGIIAGVGEELIFRGLIQRKFTQIFKNYHVAIWLSAFIFSAIHFQFYGFFPRLFLGAMFGYFYVWTGNIWCLVAAHIFNNSMAVILYHLVNKSVISAEVEKMDTIPFPAVVVCTLLATVLTFYFRRLHE